MLASALPLASLLLSGEKVTEQTPDIVWQCRCNSGLPVDASQMWILLSPQPLASLLPSGEHATDQTGEVWPINVLKRTSLKPTAVVFVVVADDVAFVIVTDATGGGGGDDDAAAVCAAVSVVAAAAAAVCAVSGKYDKNSVTK